MAESIVDDELWDEFHRLVNMSSVELQEWLATEGSGESAEGFPDKESNPRSRTVLEILGKRRTDLTGNDAETMRDIIATIRDQRGQDPEPTAGDQGWRHGLMALGHDPLRPL